MKSFRIFILFGLIFMLTGCAGGLPLPGGSDSVNESYFDSDDVFKKRIFKLEEGMSKWEVFKRLERQEEDFILMSRSEIVSALYGGQQINFVNDVYDTSNNREFLKSLSGYKLLYQSTKRSHGINSPISMLTNETGYSYSAILIFKNDILLERPVLSGGSVDTTSTKTLFDYVSPRTVMGQVGM